MHIKTALHIIVRRNFSSIFHFNVEPRKTLAQDRFQHLYLISEQAKKAVPKPSQRSDWEFDVDAIIVDADLWRPPKVSLCSSPPGIAPSLSSQSEKHEDRVWLNRFFICLCCFVFPLPRGLGEEEHDRIPRLPTQSLYPLPWQGTCGQAFHLPEPSSIEVSSFFNM